MFRYEYGYLHCIFYSLYGLFVINVHQSIFFPGFYFPHTLCERVFVDETCHDHEGVLVLHACLNVFFNVLFALFFVSIIDVEHAVYM